MMKKSLQHGSGWLPRGDIAQIEGALSPAAYVQRAYLYRKQHGRLPGWARKRSGGQWEFKEDYIRKEIEHSREYMTVHDAAKALSVSRRTVQNWIDEGVLPCEKSGEHCGGKVRNIPRKAFMQCAASLRARAKRYENSRRKQVKPVPPSMSEPSAAIQQAKGLMVRALEMRLKSSAAQPKKIGAADINKRLEMQGRIEQTVQQANAAFAVAAEIIARRLLEEVFDGKMSRPVAALTYMRLCQRDGIPDEIARNVRHEVFGTG